MSLLAKVYGGSHEQRYDKAYALLQELVERYPNNVEYRLRLAVVSMRLGLWQQARQVSQALISDIERAKPYYSRALLPELSYRLAEIHVLQGNHAAAQPILSALRHETTDSGLQAWVTLRLGNVYDLQGNRQVAQEFYRQVAGDDIAEQQAAQYVATPFTGQHPEIKPVDKTL